MLNFEFRGKSVVEAINVGLAELGRSRKDVVVKIISEGSKGLFDLMGAKPAVVLISFEE
jgi:spoIIIJ-associated protein